MIDVAALAVATLTLPASPTTAIATLALPVLGQKVLLRADLSAVQPSVRQPVLASVAEVLDHRLYAFGERTSSVRIVSGSRTPTDDGQRIGEVEVYVWQLTSALAQVLTAPGRLEFKEQDPAGQWIPATGR